GSAQISREPVDADRFILAGVGAFDHGIRQLHESGWARLLEEAVLQRGAPLLGICLGMQLVCNSSEEGRLSGLGWINAEVKRFNFGAVSNLKVPHMGWNTIKIVRSNPLLSSADGEQRFYFVHSYHVVCNDSQDVTATSYYGCEFVSALNRGSVFGVQFHPEKSHKFGMALLKRFLDLQC